MVNNKIQLVPRYNSFDDIGYSIFKFVYYKIDERLPLYFIVMTFFKAKLGASQGRKATDLYDLISKDGWVALLHKI